MQKKIRLGELLVSHNYISEVQLQIALENQKEKGIKLGESLVEKGYVSEELLLEVLSKQLGYQKIDLRKIAIDETAVKMVTESLARQYTLIPIGFNKENPNIIQVAMSDPLDMIGIEDVAIVTNMQVETVLATKSQVLVQLDQFFGKDTALAVAEKYRKQLKEELKEEENQSNRVEKAPIVTLVRTIIEQAVRQRASDIHIEALETKVRVRLRIDGELKEAMSYDGALLQSIIARIKVLSGLDIAEKRKPQDGRMSQVVDGKEYDVRISILPTLFGEKVVLRLAGKNHLHLDKEKLGFSKMQLIHFRKLLSHPNGIILVTGPTGSGKTTTLYTVLQELNSENVNIVTIEDPVEANIEGINQVPINVKADMTFANALRSILRQDPDVIMIGEIRDAETASIAVRSAITGHLVISTLHTNGTGATITRLIDMGVEPYLIGDSLVGVIAQRLVKKLCECKKERQATPRENIQLGVDEKENLRIYDPCGCKVCNQTGYIGRIGVYEIMGVTEKIKKAINERVSGSTLTQMATAQGMITLQMRASELVKSGVTSIMEMNRIIYTLKERED
jgi:type IV pilus assembly protein PilB